MGKQRLASSLRDSREAGELVRGGAPSSGKDNKEGAQQRCQPVVTPNTHWHLCDGTSVSPRSGLLH
uniref:Uncharacterized protein n=1 Tax=Oryza sativa subsp. japonica TaxID=39947 RepID=Q851I7_ORYSJ|nr:hypothetical protein [Oryza sativa Japonica Group]